MILAPEDGTIVDVNRLWMTGFGNRYKQLCYEVDDHTHRYIFGHVYDNMKKTYNGESGGTVTLKNMDSPNDKKWAQILTVNGTTYVYGQVSGTVTYNGTQYNTTTDIHAGDPLVPLGKSSTMVAHLHLNTIPTSNDHSTQYTTYNSNPLRYIDYTKADYNIKVYSQNNPNTVVPKYPGSNVTTMATKIEMMTTVSGAFQNRYDHIFDVNRVYWDIKKDYETDFSSIFGPYKQSFIQLGGRLGYELKNHPYPNFGNWTTTGVDSRAYNSGYPNQPYDIYHYSDFVTRIHKDDVMDGSALISNCPCNSRYSDGNYILRTIVEDIKDNFYLGPLDGNGNFDPIEFTLDNFKPYIKEVTVETNSGTKLYNELWSCCDNDFIKYSNTSESTSVQESDIATGMIVTVKTSEEMNNLIMSVPIYGVNNRQPYNILDNNTTFIFEIYSSEITSTGVEVVFHFLGQDKNNNDIIAFDPSYRNREIHIPTRSGNTTWEDTNNPTVTYGTDILHRFYIECGEYAPLINSPLDYPPSIAIIGEDIVLFGDIQNTFTYDCADGSIDIEVNGGIPPYEFQWSNGATTQGLEGVQMGEYCVTVTDGMCSEGTECFTVGSDNSKVKVINVQNIKECDNGVFDGTGGSIDIEVVPSNGVLTYNWEYSEDSNWHSSDEDLQNLNEGMYKVTVTNNVGCTIVSDWIPICCCQYRKIEGNFPCFESSQYGFDLSGEVHSVDSPSSTDGWIDLTVNWASSSGPYPALYYSWTGPNGFTAITEDISGLGIGTYCVTVTDGCNMEKECFKIVDCSSVTIDISGDVINTCEGYNYGKISISVSGGNSPYTYNWSNGSNTQKIQNLSAGQYCVTVLDASGCEQTNCFNVGYNQITRNNCSFYCNDNYLYTLPSDYFYDENDCRYIHWYCSDGYIIEPPEFIGLKNYSLDYNCNMTLYCYNNKIYDIISGNNCRNCIIFLDDNYESKSKLVACTVDYCYFPSINTSYVTNIHEYNSVTEISWGGRGLCHVELFNDCNGDYYDYYQNCKDVSIEDGDCYNYFQSGKFYNGDPFHGDCDGIIDPIILGRDENLSIGKIDESTLYFLDTVLNRKNIFIDEQSFNSFISNINKYNINAELYDDCSSLNLSFFSESNQISVISILNSNEDEIIKLDYNSIIGNNTIHLNNFISNDDTLIIRIDFQDTTLFKIISNDCYVNSDIKNKESELLIYPNPANEFLYFDFHKVNFYSGTKIYLKNLFGETVKIKELRKNIYNYKLDISNFPNGIYFVEIFTNNKKLLTKKIVKFKN